jgi:hypothetical protein
MTPEERCGLYDAALAEAAGWLPRFRVTTGVLSVPIPPTVWDTRHGFKVNATPPAIPHLCWRCGLEISGGDICNVPASVTCIYEGMLVGFRTSLPAARAWLQALVEVIPGARYRESPCRDDAREENKNLKSRKPWWDYQHRRDCLPNHLDAHRRRLEWRAWEKWEAPAGFDKGHRIGTALIRAQDKLTKTLGLKDREAFYRESRLVFQVGERHETVPVLPLRGTGDLHLQHSRYVVRRYAVDAVGRVWAGIRDLPLVLTSADELLRVCVNEEERVAILQLLESKP